MIDNETGIDFPFFQNQLQDLFGQPSTGGAFARDYLATMDLTEFAPHLGHVDDFQGNPWGHKVYGNYVMAGPLRKAFRLICERGLAGQLRTYDGCFNIRPMKASGRLSVHAWGLALDFNAATNPFTRGELVTDFSDDFIACWYEAGWEWGGDWRSVKDAMHFQLCWTTDWRQQGRGPKPYEAG